MMRPAITLLIDCIVAPGLVYVALVLRLGTLSPEVAGFWPAFAVAGLSCIPVLAGSDLYRHVIRYSDSATMIAILSGATVSAVIIAAVAYTVPLTGFPRSVPVIYWLLMVLYLAGSRFGFRALLQLDRQAAQREPVIIFGANPAGIQQVALLRQPQRFSFVADPTIAGTAVHSDSGRYDFRLQDLLGRDEVATMPHLLRGAVRDRRVLVTGAGGSIGSELCRQIIRQRPRLLVLLDSSEFALFEIQRELRQASIDEGLLVPVESVLGSVTDAGFLRQVFADRRVETIFHTAAYKHVEMVEHNAIAGIRNNSFGTLHAAEAARAAGATRFIFISTDKAVRTTNIMGASKRIGEMILQALEQEGGPTRFAIVRFGNVLGSSGSVVPLFVEQIAHGGPVTVTDPQVTRYFMTIPEAAGLVLQAASMSRGGDLFLLDMGEPIRIQDLARRMIRLMGYSVRDDAHPDGDVEIHFTGLRPGEKLHEELLIDPTSAVPTEHCKILRGAEAFLPWAELEPVLESLRRACEACDHASIRASIGSLIEGKASNGQLGNRSARAIVPALQVVSGRPPAKAG